VPTDPAISDIGLTIPDEPMANTRIWSTIVSLGGWGFNIESSLLCLRLEECWQRRDLWWPLLTDCWSLSDSSEELEELEDESLLSGSSNEY
jgi:hypothetical protein